MCSVCVCVVGGGDLCGCIALRLDTVPIIHHGNPSTAARTAGPRRGRPSTTTSGGSRASSTACRCAGLWCGTHGPWGDDDPCPLARRCLSIDSNATIYPISGGALAGRAAVRGPGAAGGGVAGAFGFGLVCVGGVRHIHMVLAPSAHPPPPLPPRSPTPHKSHRHTHHGRCSRCTTRWRRCARSCWSRPWPPSRTTSERWRGRRPTRYGGLVVVLVEGGGCQPSRPMPLPPPTQPRPTTQTNRRW